MPEPRDRNPPSGGTAPGSATEDLPEEARRDAGEGSPAPPPSLRAAPEDLDPPRVEVLTPEAFDRFVQAQLDEEDPLPEGSPDLERLRLSTVDGLSWLDRQPRTHKARVGLTFKVYRVCDEGDAYLARSWGLSLPTEERLGRLVAEGKIPPGEYRVIMQRGRQGFRPVEMYFDASMVASGARSSALDDALRLVREMTGGRPLLGAGPARTSAKDREALDDLRAEVSALGDRLRPLEDLAVQLANLDEGDDEGGGRTIERIAEMVLPHLLHQPEAEEAPPETNGRTLGRSRLE
jgi:hypothetical protein